MWWIKCTTSVMERILTLCVVSFRSGSITLKYLTVRNWGVRWDLGNVKQMCRERCGAKRNLVIYLAQLDCQASIKKKMKRWWILRVPRVSKRYTQTYFPWWSLSDSRYFARRRTELGSAMFKRLLGNVKWINCFRVMSDLMPGHYWL
jgi:hypothetical protein